MPGKVRNAHGLSTEPKSGELLAKKTLTVFNYIHRFILQWLLTESPHLLIPLQVFYIHAFFFMLVT